MTSNLPKRFTFPQSAFASNNSIVDEKDYQYMRIGRGYYSDFPDPINKLLEINFNPRTIYNFYEIKRSDDIDTKTTLDLIEVCRAVIKKCALKLDEHNKTGKFLLPLLMDIEAVVHSIMLIDIKGELAEYTNMANAIKTDLIALEYYINQAITFQRNGSYAKEIYEFLQGDSRRTYLYYFDGMHATQAVMAQYMKATLQNDNSEHLYDPSGKTHTIIGRILKGVEKHPQSFVQTVKPVLQQYHDMLKNQQDQKSAFKKKQEQISSNDCALLVNKMIGELPYEKRMSMFKIIDEMQHTLTSDFLISVIRNSMSYLTQFEVTKQMQRFLYYAEKKIMDYGLNPESMPFANEDWYKSLKSHEILYHWFEKDNDLHAIVYYDNITIGHFLCEIDKSGNSYNMRYYKPGYEYEPIKFTGRGEEYVKQAEDFVKCGNHLIYELLAKKKK